jgi:hypothetical protein
MGQVNKIGAWIALLVGGIAAIGLGVTIGGWTGFLVFAITALASFLVAGASLAAVEAVQVVIDIQRNTRATAQLLEQLRRDAKTQREGS